MITKEDKKFDDMAADPMRRPAAIVDLYRRRAVLFWLAIIISVCATVFSWIRETSGLLFYAAVLWSLVLKLDSDLRLLRVVERLQKGSDEKPVA
jgi:hypothetical protein